MFDSLFALTGTLVDWFEMIWREIGTWGVLGAFIIGMPILKKVCILIHIVFIIEYRTVIRTLCSTVLQDSFGICFSQRL